MVRRFETTGPLSYYYCCLLLTIVGTQESVGACDMFYLNIFPLQEGVGCHVGACLRYFKLCLFLKAIVHYTTLHARIINGNRNSSSGIIMVRAWQLVELECVVNLGEGRVIRHVIVSISTVARSRK